MEDSRIKYIPLEEIPKHLPGTNFNAGEFLYFATQRPWVEYLIKAKCYKLAVACLKENTIDIQKGAKRPWELLNITKEQFLLCAQIDANKKEWGAIQQANKYNLTITKQQIQWIDKYGELDMISAAKNTTLHKFIRYLKEQLHVESDKEAWKDYDDYLNMSGQCRYDMSREDILYPQNFKQAHDSRSEELEAIKEKRAKATEKTNDRAYKKMLPQMNELYQYEDQNYTIVIPTCKADFRKEGNENHNCVATYFDRVLDKTCTILFLREKSNPEKSFCTVEMKEDVLVQCRSHHNGKTTKEVDCFIEKYCKEIKKRLAKKEGKAS